MKNKIIVFFLVLNLCFVLSCHDKNSSIVNNKTDMQIKTDSISHKDSTYSLHENLEEASNSNLQDTGLFWILNQQIIEIMPSTTQKDNRLFCVSDDSVCAMLFNMIKSKENINYDLLKRKEAHFTIRVDKFGNIVDIDILFSSSYPNEFVKNCKNIFKTLSPLNPYYYEQLGIYEPEVKLIINFFDTGISIEYHSSLTVVNAIGELRIDRSSGYDIKTRKKVIQRNDTIRNMY